MERSLFIFPKQLLQCQFKGQVHLPRRHKNRPSAGGVWFHSEFTTGATKMWDQVDLTFICWLNTVLPWLDLLNLKLCIAHSRDSFPLCCLHQQRRVSIIKGAFVFELLYIFQHDELLFHPETCEAWREWRVYYITAALPVAFVLIVFPSNFFDSIIGSLEKNKRPINCNEATVDP